MIISADYESEYWLLDVPDNRLLDFEKLLGLAESLGMDWAYDPQRGRLALGFQSPSDKYIVDAVCRSIMPKVLRPEYAPLSAAAWRMLFPSCIKEG